MITELKKRWWVFAIILVAVFGSNFALDKSATNTSGMTALSTASETAGYRAYSNPTMSIESIQFPSSWKLTEAPDRLNFYFDSPDEKSYIDVTLYADTVSFKLPELYSTIEEASRLNGVTISQHEFETINGKEWLKYDYEMTEDGRVLKYRVAINISEKQNNRQFIKILFASETGYFERDSKVLDGALSSVVFAR